MSTKKKRNVNKGDQEGVPFPDHPIRAMHRPHGIIIFVLTGLLAYILYLQFRTEQRVKTIIDRRNARTILRMSTTRRVDTHPPAVRIGESQLQGNGVFSTQSFQVGDLIERCPILKVPRYNMHALSRYVFDDPSDRAAASP